MVYPRSSRPVLISLVRVDVGVEPPEGVLGGAGNVLGER